MDSLFCWAKSEGLAERVGSLIGNEPKWESNLDHNGGCRAGGPDPAQIDWFKGGRYLAVSAGEGWLQVRLAGAVICLASHGFFHQFIHLPGDVSPISWPIFLRTLATLLGSFFHPPRPRQRGRPGVSGGFLRRVAHVPGKELVPGIGCRNACTPGPRGRADLKARNWKFGDIPGSDIHKSARRSS